MTYEQTTTYGRIRLDEAAANELLRILRDERSTLLAEKINLRSSGRPTENQKRQLRVVGRMLSELRRMRLECGWDDESEP